MPAGAAASVVLQRNAEGEPCVDGLSGREMACAMASQSSREVHRHGITAACVLGGGAYATLCMSPSPELQQQQQQKQQDYIAALPSQLAPWARVAARHLDVPPPPLEKETAKAGPGRARVDVGPGVSHRRKLSQRSTAAALFGCQPVAQYSQAARARRHAAAGGPCKNAEVQWATGSGAGTVLDVEQARPGLAH